MTGYMSLNDEEGIATNDRLVVLQKPIEIERLLQIIKDFTATQKRRQLKTLGGAKLRSCLSDGTMPRASGDLAQIEPRRDDSRLLAAIGQDLAPRADDQRMAIGGPAGIVGAALGGRYHEAAGFDGAGAQQHMPVGAAGRNGEGGRHGQDRSARLGQRPVQIAEAQVVADGHADAAPRGLRQHRLVAGAERRRLAVALAIGEIDVEHVDLVVARRDGAIRAEQQAAVGGAILIVEPDRERTGQQPGAGPTRQILEEGDRRMVRAPALPAQARGRGPGPPC